MGCALFSVFSLVLCCSQASVHGRCAGASCRSQAAVLLSSEEEEEEKKKKVNNNKEYTEWGIPG
jgi:hypothetical protein